MRFDLLIWAAALGLTDALTFPGTGRRRDENESSALSGTKKFIVEVEQGAQLTDLSRKIEATGATVLKSFNSEVFSGLSVESGNDNLDTLQSLREVSQAWPVKTYKLAPLTPQASFSDDATAQNWSIHYSTGVDKLHEAGVFGKGAKVAVIDSGVDYRHPALGGGFGPGFKVSGGYDLVGEDYDGSNGKVPDDDPLDSLGHGTHVAGIIAGKSELIVEQGVVVTIAAGNDGDEGPFYASSGSSGKEVLAVASADTSRVPAKPWHATFSAEGVSNTTQLAYIPPVNRPLWNVTGLPIVPLSFDTKASAEACNTLPETTPDLSNVVVLVRRGGCTQYVKQTNVEKFGAQYMLIYNDDYRPFELVANSAYKSQMALIDAKAGAAIIETVKAGGNVTADFTNPADPNWAVGFFDAAGGIPSQYSSWGGTYELEIKPDIAAPGASIYSTYLNKTWKVLSGTSMATPYVAGVAALYIGKHGGRSVHGKGFAKDLSRRIISCGESLPWQAIVPQALPTDFGFFAPVAQVGTGLINATKLLESTTSLSFEKMALNDTRTFIGSHKVDITNNGDDPVGYTFAVEPAGGFNAQGRTSQMLADVLDVKPIELVPDVALPTDTFIVNPGETRTAE
ncbi:hypothetical protein COL154_011825 [Colletotrichum chrysophilum]|nr:hypothetical protein COL154_011825 [Colletotrichum chrysophilum]